jgi:hypothetical protein
MNDRKGHGTSGLSHLADVANPVDHYPVKRRREPRRLDPNWAGIAWLEAQSLADTEIIRHVDQGDGLTAYTTEGWYGARRRGAYPGPMFKIVLDLPLDPGALVCDNPCPVCDDFSRTARCPDHPEKQAGEWIPSQMEAFRGTPLSLLDAVPEVRSAASAVSQGLVQVMLERLAATETGRQASPLARFVAEQQAHGTEVRRRLAGRHQILLNGVEVTYEEERDA